MSDSRRAAEDKRIDRAARDRDEQARQSDVLCRHRLAELQTIYAAAPIGLCVLDTDLRFVRINQQMAGINGRPASEHIGRRLRELVPDMAAEIEPLLQGVIDTGQPIVDREVSGVTAAMPGSTRFWLASYFPLFNDAGQVVGINVTMLDITDRKRADRERQLLLEAEQAARAESERLNRVKDEFLATVSHEIRGPLSAILGWTRLLGSGRAEDTSRALQVIERNASSATRLVDDLLDMSRILTGKAHLNPQWVSLEVLIRGVVDGVRPSADAKSIRLVESYELGRPPFACDPDRLQQIIWNLLTNAIKFTPHGGEVGVSVRGLADAVEIVVRDTGQGVAPEFLARIFGRFQQAGVAVEPRRSGLGIGLAVVRQLVELHGGTVRAASPGLGRGAVFTVTLPRKACLDLPFSIAAPAPPSSPDPDSDLLRGLNVLLVDDDADIRELISRVLGECGAEVRTAASAEEGFRQLMELRPDVLVSDISMPQEDGYGLLRRVRACGGWCVDLLSVAVTALARPEDRERALAAGFDEHLAKPFDAATFAAVVHQRIGKRTRSASSLAEGGRGPASPSAPPDEPSRDGRRACILLVEDSSDIAEMLKMGLEDRGHRVLVAANISTAMAFARDEPVDLMISDLRLPDGTGWDLMRQIRRVRPIRGLIMSGYSDHAYQRKSREEGFDEYLVKPVDEEVLCRKIDDLLAFPPVAHAAL